MYTRKSLTVCILSMNKMGATYEKVSKRINTHALTPDHGGAVQLGGSAIRYADNFLDGFLTTLARVLSASFTDSEV